MSTFIIFSRFSPDAFQTPKDFLKFAKEVSAKIKSDCPQVQWKDSYATLGRFDVVDIVEADEPEAVERAAMIIRSYGHSTTETLTATPWKKFLKSLE